MSSDECPFFSLPSPIITDILISLPTKTILQCRCVCKTWLKLLSDSEFVSLHLLKSPTRLIINNLSSGTPESFVFNLVEIEDESHDHDLHYVAGSKMELPKRGSNMTMVGSINGLVCLNEFDHPFDVLHIWNPTISQSMSIQTPNRVRTDPNIVRYGFGICSATNHYKVVRIFQELEILDSTSGNQRLRRSECQVYTLGEGSWRSIEHAPFHYSRPDHGIFLNGNLHWLIEDPDGSEFISFLDLEKELFLTFPPPPGLSKGNKATLNLYKGCLSVCDKTTDSGIVIWVMKEYGMEKSWSKEVIIPLISPLLFGSGRNFSFRVLEVLKDGGILLLYWDLVYMVRSYHPEKKTWKSFDCRDLIGAIKRRTCVLNERCPPIQAVNYTSSILSLKSFGTETVKMLGHNCSAQDWGI